MKIGQYALRPTAVAESGVAARASILIPPDANVIHLGAQADGNIYLWAEVPEVEAPVGEIEVIVLRAGQTIPDGYKYRAAVLSNPMLFVYQRMPDAPKPSGILVPPEVKL